LKAPPQCAEATYIYAIHKVGGIPVILPTVLRDTDWPVLIEHLDGLLLSGGGDIHPSYYGQEPEEQLGSVDEDRDAAELGITRLAVKYGLPVFGICRGQQTLNVALGGTLYQDIASHIPDALEHTYISGRPMGQRAHTVTLEADSRLAQILGGTAFEVNSAHHQAVKMPGEGVRIVAHATDGVVEAIELPDHPFCLSVQWHPEAMVPLAEEMWPLFKAFVAAASDNVPF
jgi:putative glutamine amidotransferase